MAVVAILFVTAVSAVHIENLPWRPTCQNDVNGPPPAPWNESFNSAKRLKFCQYNDTVMFFPIGVARNFDGNWFKRTWADAYINHKLADNSPFAIGHPNNFLRLEFEYYFPLYEDGVTCFNETGPKLMDQLVFIANEEADTFGTDDFNAGRYTMTSAERNCGEWMQFNKSASAFKNEFGKSFDANKKTVGALSFEIGNMYVRNARFVTYDGIVTQVW